MSANESIPGLSDKLYDDYVKYLTNGTIPDSVSSTVANFTRDAKKHEVKLGVLIRKKKLVLKKSELGKVWKAHHIDLLHPGNSFCTTKTESRGFCTKSFFTLNFQKKVKTVFLYQKQYSFTYFGQNCPCFKVLIYSVTPLYVLQILVTCKMAIVSSIYQILVLLFIFEHVKHAMYKDN